VNPATENREMICKERVELLNGGDGNAGIDLV